MKRQKHKYGMEVKEYTVTNTSEFKGELTLVVEHNGETYELLFDFQRHGTPPHAHSPFPSPDKEIYAWPAQDLPENLLFEAGTEKAQTVMLAGVGGLPDGINLIQGNYQNIETGKSPFIKNLNK
jgi:hypothetical protein